MIRITSFAVAAGMALAVSTAAAQSTPRQPPAPPVPAQSASTAIPPQDFMMKASEAGMAEVDLAVLAQQKATDSRVKSYAATLQKDHTAANASLKQIATKQSVTLPTMAPSSATATKSQFEKLSGAAFDRAYVDQMVRDHQQAVELFEQAAKSTNADVKAFAEKTLPTLREHLQKAQDLKRALGGEGGM
jgi:putative membrane protein